MSKLSYCIFRVNVAHVVVNNGEKLELLTNEKARSIEVCKQIIWYYKDSFKTGCKIEERQLKTIKQHKIIMMKRFVGK
ncbi:MAG: hypothetical protein ACP5JP_08980 [bacterium]